MKTANSTTSTGAGGRESALIGIDRLLSPRSIAVIGASPSPGKIGNVLMRNLDGFTGALYPVHPTATKVLGLGAYSSVTEIGQAVDLALLAIPPSATIAALADCVAAKVGAAVLYSGGWAEAGAEGRNAQGELHRVARSGGMRLLGPNTSGFIKPGDGIFATFVADLPQTVPPGSLTIVAQSGGVNLSLCFLAQTEGLGVRLGVGLGNACDVGMADILDWLYDDPQTSVVVLAVEGVIEGRQLCASIERLTARCPVIAVTVGRHDIGQFAQSHTGMLSGSFRVKRAALAQAGAVVVDDLTELIDAAQALVAGRIPPCEDVGVGLVTGQAGPGLLLADELRANGARLPKLPDVSRRRLAQLLPPLTYQENPVDTGRPGDSFRDVLSTVRHSDGIDLLAVSLIHEPDAVNPADALAGLAPVVLCSCGPADSMAALKSELGPKNIAVFPTPDRAAKAISALLRDARHRWRLQREDTAATDFPLPVRLPNPSVWDEETSKSLLDSLGIATPRRIVSVSHEAARSAFVSLRKPVVVKLLHSKIAHKSEAGGVHLNVSTLEELDLALRAIDRVPGSRYLIEEMAPSGPELLLGARNDAAFGPLVLLGRGGVEAELDDDIAIRLTPLGEIDARDMLGELRSAPLFRGFRGGPTVDERELARVIRLIGAFIALHTEITEIEINPLRLTRNGLLALDALVIGKT